MEKIKENKTKKTMFLECQNCGHKWSYGGNSEHYCTCPKCHYLVNVSKCKVEKPLDEKGREEYTNKLMLEIKKGKQIKPVKVDFGNITSDKSKKNKGSRMSLIS